MNKKWIGIVVCTVLLSGCGQSGPLYLPAPPKPATSMPANPVAVQPTAG